MSEVEDMPSATQRLHLAEDAGSFRGDKFGRGGEQEGVEIALHTDLFREAVMTVSRQIFSSDRLSLNDQSSEEKVVRAKVAFFKEISPTDHLIFRSISKETTVSWGIESDSAKCQEIDRRNKELMDAVASVITTSDATIGQEALERLSPADKIAAKKLAAKHLFPNLF